MAARGHVSARERIRRLPRAGAYRALLLLAAASTGGTINSWTSDFPELSFDVTELSFVPELSFPPPICHSRGGGNPRFGHLVVSPSNHRKSPVSYSLLVDVVLGAALFVVLLGIFLSFSRAAWLVAALATFGVLAWAMTRGFRQKTALFRQAVRLSILLAALTIMLFVGFGRFVFPRALQTVGGADPSVSGRIAYQNLGISLIAERPWGVGLGNQVLYGVESGAYQKRGMTRVWQWEPIHNLYLLMASEVGMAGLAAFLMFLAMLLWNARGYHDNNDDNDQKERSQLIRAIVIVILSSLLAFGLFDHFLWTLEPGRLMLWLAIGIVMGRRCPKTRFSPVIASPPVGG